MSNYTYVRRINLDRDVLVEFKNSFSMAAVAEKKPLEQNNLMINLMIR